MLDAFDNHIFQWSMLILYLISFTGIVLDQEWRMVIPYLNIIVWIVAYMIKERSKTDDKISKQA